MTFKNGLYSINGQGPHFPREIFIYYNHVLYSFSNSDSDKVLEEFIKSFGILGLNEKDKIEYLSAICTFLREELKETYGAEIK